MITFFNEVQRDRMLLTYFWSNFCLAVYTQKGEVRLGWKNKFYSLINIKQNTNASIVLAFSTFVSSK